MKKLFLGIAVLLALGMLASVAVAGVGNSIPKGLRGEHYTLNIIGVELKEDKDKAVGDSKGHTLFVPLWGKCKINMTQDPDGEFKVVDRNGTDGVAEFNIAPGYYNVFAAALGKPNRGVRITSWGEFEDALAEGGTVLLDLGVVDLTREKGKSPQSVNISELFFVDVMLCLETGEDADGNAICVKWVEYTDYWVFDIDELLGYYWDYDNTNNPDEGLIGGLKLLQVRFYPCTLDCTGTASDYCRWATVSPEFPDGDPICSMRQEIIPDAVPTSKNAAPAVNSNVTTTWGDIKE